MKKVFDDSDLIKKYSPALGGVFLFSELEIMFAEAHRTETFRRIRRLEELGLLSRFKKGIYVTPDFSLHVLNQKIAPESYISFSTILSEHLIIGIVPKYQVDAVKPGKTRIYMTDQYTLRQFGCANHLIFGYKNINGLNKATPEKAILDTFYFHQHGAKFPFDIYSDINWSKLDKDLIISYLKRYKNPKFAKFVEGVMNEAT